MKNLFVVLLLISGLYSCQKDRAVINNNVAASWISGKWKRVSLIDTVFSGSSIAGINNFPVNLNPNELNFTTSTTGTSGVYGSFTYTLTGNTFVDSNGNTYYILQKSTTSMSLTKRTNGVGYGDFYTKE